MFFYNRYKERSEIEALFFATNTQLATLRQPSFIPPEGVSLYALQKAWDALEKAEHRREVALRNELLRLERLEQLAYKFERKVCNEERMIYSATSRWFRLHVNLLLSRCHCLQGLLRDGYLKEMIQVLSDPRYGSNLTQVEATVKKHEAICADILSRVRDTTATTAKNGNHNDVMLTSSFFGKPHTGCLC
jgi:spectrin beta